MYIVCVTVIVKPDKVAAFKEAILDNAKNTRLEPGNVRFDVLQGEENPARFFLYEAYHRAEDFAIHQKTAHYLRWKDAVADWMANGRTVTKNAPLFFDDSPV